MGMGAGGRGRQANCIFLLTFSHAVGILGHSGRREGQGRAHTFSVPLPTHTSLSFSSCTHLGISCSIELLNASCRRRRALLEDSLSLLHAHDCLLLCLSFSTLGRRRKENTHTGRAGEGGTHLLYSTTGGILTRRNTRLCMGHFLSLPLWAW